MVLCDSSTSDGISNDRHTRKEQSKNRRNESNNNDAPANKVARIFSNAVDDDDDDIEIIECSGSSSADTADTAKSHDMEKKSKSVKQVSKCAPDSSPIQGEVNGTTKKREFPRHIIRPQIIDIDKAEPCPSSKAQDDDDIMEIDLTPPSSNNVNTKLVHTNLSNKEQGDFNNSISDVNVKQEPQNDPEPSAPAIIVKKEPDWGSFSQIDIIELNDDDDGAFPSSQLFDRTVVKEELDEEDNDNNAFHSSLFLDDQDDNVVTILDSDEDDDLIISGDSTMYPMQKIKIEPGLEPALEFVDVGVAAHPTVSSETDNVCQNNLDVPNHEQVDSAAMLIASLTTEQSLEEQLSALHQEPLLEPSTSKDPLIDKQTSVTNEISTGTDISPTKDASTSSNKDTKKSKKKGLEICEPHFIKPKKRGERATKKDVKKSKSKDESENKSDKKRRHSANSSKDSSLIKDSSEKSSKKKEHKKDKDTSKHSSKKSSRSKESSKKSKSLKDKHQSTSSELESHQEANNLPKNKNDENHNKNLSKSFENNSNNSDMLNQSRPKNKTTIVKAKVSAKTRGDMLCEEMLMSRPKPRKDVRTKASEPAKEKTAPKPDNISSFVIPRRQVLSSTIPSSSMSMVSQLNTPPSISQTKDIPSTLMEDPSSDMDISPPSSPFRNERSPSPLAEPVTNCNNASAIPSLNTNLKSALKSANLNTSQKKVLFKDNIAAVREFAIEEGNLMRNIKDGNNLRSGKKDFIGYRTTELKIEDFLARVFAWEPVWLEQQQKIKTLPPIVKAEDMRQLPNTFTSFDQYYKRMEVLLLLETWQYLVKEYECTGNRYILKNCNKHSKFL